MTSLDGQRKKAITPEWREQLAQGWREWRAAAFSTDSFDRTATKEAICNIYREINMEPPIVFYCQSPWQVLVMPIILQLMLRSSAVREMREPPGPLRESALWSNMWQNLWRQLDAKPYLNYPSFNRGRFPLIDALLTSLETIDSPDAKELESNLWERLAVIVESKHTRLTDWYEAAYIKFLEADAANSLREQYETQFAPRAFRSIRAQARASLRFGADVEKLAAQIASIVPEKERDQLAKRLSRMGVNTPDAKPRDLFSVVSRDLDKHQIWWGTWALNRMPFFENLADELVKNLSDSHRILELRLWLRLARQTCAVAFFEPACFVCDRPNKIAIDNRGRLHHESSTALSFSDGFELYSWHGATVPKEIIEHPESITVDAIDRELNVEVRRVMLERFGESRYLSESNSQIIHEDQYGVLYSKVLQDDEPLVMVKVINSTAEEDGFRREYFLRVPPHITTARAAVAWTFGFLPDEYGPDVES